MTDIQTATFQAELEDESAARGIENAVSGRRSIARKYVMRLRNRHPEASPAEVVGMLERHYGTAISTAGAALAVGAVAADVAIALIPGVGAAAAGAKSAGQQAAKKTGKEAAKAAAKLAAKNMAKDAAKTGASRLAALLPAGDEQLQFEITSLFALAIAEIHGMDLDKDQARALVYGLTNDRVSQQQIATMAADVAGTEAELTPVSAGASVLGNRIAAGRGDWSHWAGTLADSLPGGAAQSFVRTIQTGQLETVRETLSGKQQATIEYGVGALVGGMTRFVFGREVVKAARIAFAEAPHEFPVALAVTIKADRSDDDGDDEQPNRALLALEDAAKSAGDWISDAAGTVGGGVAKAAGTVSRPFRSVDIDGDGIPDEPRALTAVKGVGGSLAGAADAMGESVAGLFRHRKRNKNADAVASDGLPAGES